MRIDIPGLTVDMEIGHLQGGQNNGDGEANRTMNNRRRPLAWGCALIVLLTLVAYLPALRGGFVWDDNEYVTENQTLRSFDGLEQIWLKPEATPQYYPLVFTSFWAEYHLWKLHPFGYHLVNVLLHALSAILLWRVLRRLKLQGAWWAAAIFALHPIQVESVAWITERKNVLSGVFYFLALLAYFRFRTPKEEAAAVRRRDWRFYRLVIGLFLCALLSKTVTLSLPAVILLLVWWKTGRLEKQDVLELAPLFVMGAGLGLVTAWLEKHHVGASGAEWALSLGQRCLLAGRALWFYAGKLFWPRQLTFIYPRWEIDAGAWWQYVFPVAAVVVLSALWLLRQRIGRGPLVAVLCFAGTLAPALGFMDVYPFRYSFVADHFQYLACIGLITLAASAGATICKRAGGWSEYVGVLTVAAVLMMLGASTWRQCHVYRDLETLWRDTLAKNPGAWLAHNNVGVALASQGKLSEAMAEYTAALRANPDFAESHYNMGNALASQGKLLEAVAEFREAVRDKPKYASAHYNMGNALASQGKVSEAVAEYREALRINPDNVKGHNNLGAALASQGKLSEAMAEYTAALRINPDFAEAHNNLGLALAGQGRLAEATAEYTAALRSKPDYAEAHYDLGVALVRLGRVQEAIGHLQQAVRIQPDSAAAHYNLALALEQAGNLKDAIGHFEQAVRIKPDFAEAHNNLGNALARKGQLDGAIEHYHEAVRIKPDYAEAHYNLAVVLIRQGKVREAVRQYEQVMRIKPDSAEVENNLAWLLATFTPADGGDPVRAVALAQHACELTGNRVPGHVDTLAAAYAAAGRFSEAIATAQNAIELARSTGQTQLGREIENRLQLYRDGRAFRLSAGGTTPPIGNPSP
jgi:tetratricopeptide (TPR) repeat protein